jgi:hypothetical protein
MMISDHYQSDKDALAARPLEAQFRAVNQGEIS